MSLHSPLPPESRRQPLGFGSGTILRTLLAFAVTIAQGSGSLPARAGVAGIGEIVKTFCLSAFENEMTQAGKSAPAGMAHYACDCVADRITSGSSLEMARSSCREATARRYAL
jgi:hypothetical protein